MKNEEYFVGQHFYEQSYWTPAGCDRSYPAVIAGNYHGWQFLGFSFEDPRTTEDWNADFAHLTPFAKGDDDEVVVAPYAVWRKKEEVATGPGSSASF